MNKTMVKTALCGALLLCSSAPLIAADTSTPNVEPKVGFRIFTKVNRPNQELVESFRGLPVANISDMVSRTRVVDARIKKISKNNLLGVAFTVKTRPDDNLMAHKAIQMAQPGDIIVIDARGDLNNAIIGEQMVRTAIQRKLAGIIVDGAVRDYKYLTEQTDIPVYAAGVTPAGPYKDGPGEINTPVNIGGIVVRPGDILIGDDDGIVVIEPSTAKQVAEQSKKKNDAEASAISKIVKGEQDHSWIDRNLQEKSVQIIDDYYQ
ncbi:RraA family protein [Azorhizophilus paspali]|uniref:Putative 4-hydroxy-4-methyl-2-oxoglutarate aldolase n=1 Tax=Azorhizophilus paspali TaxID=69963 RepID=A0ABV6SGY4_AZOPA